MDQLRQKVVQVARSQIGQTCRTEYITDTCRGNPAAYHGINWCGIFCLWCLHQARLALGWKWRLAVGFLYRLPHTKHPQPGDIAYFTRFQHEAIVSDIADLGSEMENVNGNGANNRVTEGVRPQKDAACFFSIGPLIAVAQQAPVGRAHQLMMAMPDPPDWEEVEPAAPEWKLEGEASALSELERELDEGATYPYRPQR